jgi:hypothetical protein
MWLKTKQEFEKADFPQLMALDTETTSLNPREAKIEGIGWGDGKKQYYIDWASCDFKEDVKKKLTEVFKINTIIFHNAKFDIKILKSVLNIDFPEKIHDTMIMSYLLDENRGHGLKELTKTLLKRAVVEYDDVAKTPNLFQTAEMIKDDMANYCCADVKNTFDLYTKFSPLIEKEEITLCYEKIELPLIKVLSEMELRGVKIDLALLQNLENKAEAILLEKESLIKDLVGSQSMNVRSSKQLRDLIFDKLGVSPVIFTPGGEPSTDNESLKLLAKSNNAVKAILDFREFDKLNGTYLVGLKEKAEDGILYTDFLQHRTRSGRLACVPLSTKILTKRGWKYHFQLVIGEEVMGFDIQKEEYIWTKLRGLHKGKGETGILKTNRGHGSRQGIWCTEGHRWVVKNNNIVGFSKAKHIQRGFRVLVQPKKKFPAVEKSVLNEYEASLLGWYLTDGFLTGKKNYGLGVTLAKKRSISILSQTLVGKEFTTHKYQPYSDGNWVTNFHISSKVFYPIYCKMMSLSPDELILGMDEKARKSMFDAMLEGDGSMRRNKKRYNRFGALLIQKKRTCEYFELLSISLGQPYTSRIIKLPKTGNDFVGYHLLQEELKADENSKWKPEKEEEVWCPETDCGTWVLKQDNQIAITGNSANPNLQNIPARSDDFDIRKAFIPRPGYKLIVADYSQIELRIVAHYSQEDSMMKTFREGGDIHQLTADMVGCTRKHAKCFSGDTSIVFEKGNKKIKEVVKNREEKKNIVNFYPLKCLDYRKKYNNVVSTYYEKNVKEWIRFDLENGDFVEVTPEHRMIIKRKNKIIECLAKEVLKTDEFIED